MFSISLLPPQRRSQETCWGRFRFGFSNDSLYNSVVGPYLTATHSFEYGWTRDPLSKYAQILSRLISTTSSCILLQFRVPYSRSTISTCTIHYFKLIKCASNLLADSLTVLDDTCSVDSISISERSIDQNQLISVLSWIKGLSKLEDLADCTL